MNDNVRPERSQAFGYDALSRISLRLDKVDQKRS